MQLMPECTPPLDFSGISFGENKMTGFVDGQPIWSFDGEALCFAEGTVDEKLVEHWRYGQGEDLLKHREIVATQSDTDGFKYTCPYCGGYTKDDSRGNCSACGAPR